MGKRIFISIVALSIFVLSSTTYANDVNIFKGLSGTLHIAGGTAHIACEKEAIKTIIRANPDVNITIAGGGSGVGIKQVCEDLIGIGNTGRAPTDDEISRCRLKVFKFAIDGIGVIVNPRLNVGNLSKDDLAAVFSGKIPNWKYLGGPDASINIYTRDAESGTREVFWSKGLGKGDINPKANFVASNAAMKTAVANDPLGIGYISLGVADDSVKLLSIEGVFPSNENVVSEKYTIARGLYMNTRGEPEGLQKAFIDYMLSVEGQTLVRKHGFISVE